MKNNFVIALLLSFLPYLPLWADNDNNSNTYETPERLFHIARSVNKNLICYDVNLQDSRLNASSPLKVYWVNREEHPGETNGLNYIQRKLAYGYKVVQADQETATCTLTAYPKRQLTVRRYHSHYVCLIKINNQQAILQSLYVKASPRNPLKVEYVELIGKSLITNKQIKERINN